MRSDSRPRPLAGPLARSRLAAAALVLPLGLGVALSFVQPRPAAAFCGFYVAGADASLYNDATMVVLMRDGKRTVLSMQNDYQGPAEDFALVIPVPVVLHEGDVKVLPTAVFEHVDKLAAPRLVEYWEQDPCEARRHSDRSRQQVERGVVLDSATPPDPSPSGVVVEAEFVVGEYEVVILSAKDSTGLDTWLHEQDYNIPEGAEPVLRPYVEGGMKFFVAKVDVDKVQFETKPDGSKRAMLSPLRFHYDSDEFSLPIRLGMINAQGPQDLLVHVLAPNQRYEAANYPNLTIPSNLVVNEETQKRFGQFYVSLFDHTLANHRAAHPNDPPAVITEYAWSASSCDPCPDPPMTLDELVLLGADVLPTYADDFDEQGQLVAANQASWRIPNDFVLTRLHARYDQDSLGEDLVFQAVSGIAGGQGTPAQGKLDPTVRQTGGAWSSFQARYAMLHYWEGTARCMRPLWDTWGGPPSDGRPGAEQPATARQLAFEPRDAKLASFMTLSAHQQLKLDGPAPADERPERTQDAERKAAEQAADKAAGKRGCACTLDEPSTPAGPLGWALLGALSLATLPRKRR